MHAPPPLLLAAYRLLGWRLGPEHRDWAFTDITSRGYLLRQSVPVVLAIGVLLALVFSLTGSTPVAVVPPLLVVLVLIVPFRKGIVERALRQQGLTADGEVAPEARAWADDPEARHRRSVAGALVTVVLVTAGLLLIAYGPGRDL